MTLTLRQAAVLVLLTLIWGFNWPIMKLGVAFYPPLTFRAVSMWLGLPLLWVVLLGLRVPLAISREHWRELASLSVTNMLVWYAVAIIALQSLASGRAAILGYTMPVFSALVGRWFFAEQLSPRQLAGVLAATLGAGLLLAHEFGTLAGKPVAALGMLAAAAAWAVGTQQLRRTRIAAPTLAIAFWMTVLTTPVISLFALLLEAADWRAPDAVEWAALAYNAVLVFGYAQPAWLYLARSLPPVASTLSVMFVPVLGVACGAWLLGETLHWQDYAAIVLIVLAIASVLWPRSAPMRVGNAER